jgi:peptide subunit release factor 1 (eRF1)
MSDKKQAQKDLKEINKARKLVGLKPIEPTKRKCLRCDKEFISYGANHRMCGCTKSE